MPTLPPKPVDEPVNEQEQLRRIGAVTFICTVLGGLRDRSYGTRSHMPCGEDYTDFCDLLDRVSRYVKARPDWAGQIVESAFRQFGPEESVQIELDRLRSVISEFEERSGVSIHDHGYIDRRMADAVKVVMEIGGPDAYLKKMRTSLEETQRRMENMASQVGRLLAGEQTS